LVYPAGQKGDQLVESRFMGRQGLTDIIDFSALLSVEEPQAPLSNGGIIFVRMPKFDEIETLHELTAKEIGPNVAPLEAMQDVYRHNPETMWMLFRSPTEDRAQGQLAGYYAFLHLNKAGLEALEAKTLRPRQPDLRLIAPAGERPAAVYIWAIIARKLNLLAIPLVGKGLGVKRYGGLPFYATAATMSGLNGLKGYGFKSSAPADDGHLGDVFKFYMPGEADRPASSAA
jgi:hypothetical protein